MKKVLGMLVLMSMASMSAYAYDQTDRIKDMQAMETAMAEIQKGLLYNNKALVIEGVANLKKASANVEIAPKGAMDFSERFAKRQAEYILKYSGRVEINIKDGYKHGAIKNYTNVLKECISCHNKIRKWN